MNAHAAFRPFHSRNAGFNRAKPAWACKACGGLHTIKPDKADRPCRHCGEDAGRWHLASKAERLRFAQLRLRQGLGEIDQLVCQPRFELRVNGVKVTTYVGDFQFMDRKTGHVVIEDVKPKQFQTDISKLKIKLFDAIHGPRGVSIRIVRM